MYAISSGSVISADGTRLAYRIYNPSQLASDTLPVICLPGLTRNARDFHDIAVAIATDPVLPRKVVCLDYRGRGNSDRAADPVTYNVLTETQDCLLVLDELNIDKCIFIGTSRGGLILHIMAQLSANRIHAAVLNDVGPELALEGLAQIKAYLSGAETAPPSTWHAAERQLAHIHGAAFPALSDEDWRDWAKAIYTENDGHLIMDCDPAIAHAFANIDLSQPLPDLWQQFELLSHVPMMVIRGEHSKLLTQETVAAMEKKHPGLQSVTAAGQGHAPLLHKEQVREPLLRFLKEQ